MSRTGRTVFFFVSLSLIGLVLFQRLGPSAGLADPGRALLEPQRRDEPAPPVSLLLRDGTSLALSGASGRHLLVNFWASWCAPCIEELPHLAALARLLRNRELRLVLVSVDEDFAAVDRLAATLAERGAEDPSLLAAARLLRGDIPGVVLARDPDEKAARAFGTFKYPETFLIDPEGRVRFRFVGPKAWSHPRAVEFLDHLLPSTR
ncbi:MAG: TlpA family protein disulfide reductase [Myxococcales bacterium]|nr:TlpA family protein disulfide reductase [Myxococcales bacterium]